MKLSIWMLAPWALLLSACSTTPPPVPVKIDPPPVALISRCLIPPDLVSEATARDLAEWAVAWIGVAGCERAKRQALLEAWPR